MTTLDESTEFEVNEVNGLDVEPMITLDLSMNEAEALRTWLLRAAAEGVTSLDDPLVSSALAKLGRVVDAAQATTKVRRELEQAGLNIAHLSDDQVDELARRVSDVAVHGLRD